MSSKETESKGATPIEDPENTQDKETIAASDNTQGHDLKKEVTRLELELDNRPDYTVGVDQDVEDLDEDSQDAATLERVETIKSLNDEIPDKLSGWGLLAVIGTGILNANTWGANSAYALYLQEYLNNTIFRGTTKIEYGMVGGLSFAAGFLIAPLINRLVGIIGPNTTIRLGIVVEFAGMLLASFSKKLWHLCLTQGLLQGVGMALITLPAFLIIPQWFKGGPGGKRNWALGLATAGSGIGGIIYNSGMEPILEDHGWRWALRTQALICIVLSSVASFMMKSRDTQIKPVYKVYDKLVWANFGVIMMMLWSIFTLLGYVTLMYNLADFTRSLGYSSKQASTVATMTSVGIIYGRPAVGYVADIIGPVQATILASWIVGLLSFAMWIPCRNYATALVMALFQGSLMGTIWLTSSSLMGAVVGLRKFGIGMSISMVIVGISGFASPIVGIALKADGATSPTQYRHPAIFVGCVYFAASFALCILRAWLIAREKAFQESGKENRLEVSVKPRDTLKCMLTLHQKV